MTNGFINISACLICATPKLRDERAWPICEKCGDALYEVTTTNVPIGSPTLLDDIRHLTARTCAEAQRWARGVEDEDEKTSALIQTTESSHTVRGTLALQIRILQVKPR